jgi:4-hydroxythreonine-4-phosphate dehydrogenase
LKAFQSGQDNFVLMENAERLELLSKQWSLDIDIKVIDEPESFQPNIRSLQIINIDWNTPPIAGCSDANNAKQIINAIETGARWAQQGRVAALTTNPISKSTLYEAGFRHPGHTEFLGSLAPPTESGPVMMLACDALRVVPLTIHIPLANVAASISSKLIIDKTRLVAEQLSQSFGITDPRIAVCGLNPHAGENGKMGLEDQDIIAPAIAALRAEGINASGPHPADTMFHADARQTYDVAIGMYHDQVLVPLKTLDFFGGVNITLGLDFIRTSPDHGTGLDIAGSGRARPDSLIAAISTAYQMATRHASVDIR